MSSTCHSSHSSVVKRLIGKSCRMLLLSVKRRLLSSEKTVLGEKHIILQYIFARLSNENNDSDHLVQKHFYILEMLHAGTQVLL